jgi:hypothetical protein
MVLCTLARNHLKMTRFSSMGWKWNDLKVCFTTEKTFQPSSVHHETEFGGKTSEQTIQNLSASESEFIHHRIQNGRKKVSSIMVSCVNKIQSACFIAQSGCKNKHTRTEIIQHSSYQMQ